MAVYTRYSQVLDAEGNLLVARELAYRLYTICERKKSAAEALT